MKMMEIYLNIVEFGPDIYGLKNAAKHFFNKEPIQLNVYEMIWLVRRLPRPRFNSVPKEIGEPLAKSMNRLLDKMEMREFVEPETYAPIQAGPWPQKDGDWSNFQSPINKED